MKIKYVEIQNFRKLQSVRLDLASETTVFVGANNSGKTSAILALRRFLVDPRRFDVKDFTLSHWKEINKVGKKWIEAVGQEDPIDGDETFWIKVCPSLDVWLDVEVNEVHHVRHLIPTLDWAGGLLGVRLVFCPKSVEDLRNKFAVAGRNARKLVTDAGDDGADLKIWPTTLSEFIERRLLSQFERRSYLLDPTNLQDPEKGLARPQELLAESEPLDVAPFEGLIRIDDIPAHRGFSDVGDTTRTSGEHNPNDVSGRTNAYRLSEQLRSYYSRHLDPTDGIPESSDLDALKAIKVAQDQFDEKLREGFSAALNELEDLGYPGVTDPKVTISSRIRPAESLNHASAVQYDVANSDDDKDSDLIRLPEQYIGLGYQNLISMVFRLMSFRDAWMQVGKAARTLESGSLTDIAPEPIHLVMVEEPEVHLHAQVQQVFIRKAHHVLRKHENLGKSPMFSTQLVVSTHSSHIAHESDFASLRYFRRLPAGEAARIPISSVVNLSEVFGPDRQTARFVARYLKTTHCDLFFADAAILVEGPAERMLIPHFIRNSYQDLHKRYVTLLEIGGSHAHRLRSLIEKLHLPTLIVTDLDPAENKKGQPITIPARGKGHITRNAVLRYWLPHIKDLDKLLDLPFENKVDQLDSLFSVRVAYQAPVMITLNDNEAEAIATTFEDALAIENLDVFKTLKGKGLVKKFRDAITSSDNVQTLSKELRKALADGQKAAFALDILFMDQATEVRPPTYIAEGLSWLQTHLETTKVERLSTEHLEADHDG